MAAKAQGTSRAKQRASSMRAASGVQVPARVDVCVVGGGASGLAAAIVAAAQGVRVVVLERDPECGRTILATGNGRCNFANTHLDAHAYNDPTFVEAACGAHWLEDVLGFFRDCGLAWVEEAQGRLYPLSRQAASVRNVLLDQAQRAGVTLAPAREVTGIRQRGGCLRVSWRDRFGAEEPHELSCSCTVVATGGMREATGGMAGLEPTPSRPVLCPLACTGPALSTLNGRRAHATVELVRAGHIVAREEGEVLFRDYGLSGIALFNLSRHAQPEDEVRLDLLPTLSFEGALAHTHHTLDGILDPVVAQALLDEIGDAHEAVRLAKQLRYRVNGPAQTNKAQVMRGGLPTSLFHTTTLAARAVSGLYACGEALDVDGPCGGFNLAWAWKSGMVAGAAAAREAREAQR